MSNQTEFKRLNFFTGLFTTADDWLQEQNYHLEKRRLHLGGLHSPGVIAGIGEECQVRAAGGMSVRVASGAALDGKGNLIYLPAPSAELVIEPPASLPATVYVVIEYTEKPTDYRLNPEDADYSGSARVTEIPRVSCAYDAPDNKTALELARIDLHPDVTEIADPADPAHPKANEIDCRSVLRAGAVDAVRDRTARGDPRSAGAAASLSPGAATASQSRLVQGRDHARYAGRVQGGSGRRLDGGRQARRRLGRRRPRDLPGRLAHP